jgi:hypothetical protein
MYNRPLAYALLGVLGSFSIAACDLDVPDLNNPLLDDLENNPNEANISAACTGLLIGNRRNLSAANGYVDVVGILGREALNVDNADPRYSSELLAGVLSRASPFGGNFWTLPYRNIRLGNIILRGVDSVAAFSPEEKSAIRGFVHTIQALDYLEVIVTHDTNGAVIDTDRELGEPLAPVADKAEVYAHIADLLDDAAMELSAGGGAFPFALSSGFAGRSGPAMTDPTFNVPPGFRKFNRAMRARVAAHMKDYATVIAVLPETFIDDVDPIDFKLGVYHSFSTKAGDATNGLINVNILVNRPMIMEAQMNGATVDARVTAKTSLRMDDMNFVYNRLYPGPDASVPLIRNEELILLKAEALFFKTPSDPVGAVAELNIVRVGSGGLLPLVGVPSDATFTDQLLYERRYSLMFEGGHRWIDLRRFGRLLPLDKPTDTRNVRFPIPIAECDARPGEPKCTLGSTDT